MNNSENSRRFFLKKSMVGTAMVATTNPFKLEAKDFPFGWYRKELYPAHQL